MSDDLYIDLFIGDAASMGHADILLIVCAWIGGLVLLTLAVFIGGITQTALQRGTITRGVARRRLIFISGFGMLAALAAPLPTVLAAGVDGIASALIWELIGVALITLFAFAFRTALAQHTAHGTDPGETGNCHDDEDYQRSRGVNPATGYPMINNSIDAGGHAYGCGSDHSDDRYWDR